MKFTDLFIKRPVLASVVSLLIFLVGLQSIFHLSLRQYPKTENTVITVNTAYPGANAQLMEGFITTPIEKAIASAEGVDYITSTSTQGSSSVQAHIRLNFDPNEAFTNVMSQVQSVRNQLPQASENPVINKDTGSQIALMYLSFASNAMTPEQITDYLKRVVQPKLETLPGVAQAQVLGSHQFAMRIWLQPKKLAAYHLTPQQVIQALKDNNVQSAAGKTKGVYTAYPIDPQTGLNTAKQFRQLVVKNKGNSIVHLSDVAKVKLGSRSYNAILSFNDKKASFIAIKQTPSANPLSVAQKVKNTLPTVEKQFPRGLNANIVYDGTKYISSSIDEVIHTIVEAAFIVIVVIFLFLGSIRAVSIPVVTIPLSLVGVASIMLAMGYSINLLTLLAMVLAIGLVVDDAIVVVENLHRHIEAGLPRKEAAIKGAREIAGPVIAMTTTLAAVFAPIGFMGGLTGALFTQFAFTLAGTVIISGVIALTLSPMMCSKILTKDAGTGFASKVNHAFNKLKNFYGRYLRNALHYRPAIYIFAIGVLISCPLLYVMTSQELAPQEDQGALFITGTGPKNANIDYMGKFSKQLNHILANTKSVENRFIVTGMGGVNNLIAGAMLKPWSERPNANSVINPKLSKKLRNISGLKAASFSPPALPGSGGGMPIQFVLTSTGSYQTLAKLSKEIKQKAEDSGQFIFLSRSLKFNNQEVRIHINRDKAAAAGLNMSHISQLLAGATGGDYINWFTRQGRNYRVIPQIQRSSRLNPQQLRNIYINTSSNQVVPLSTFTSLQYNIQPNKLEHFQQLNSVTIQGLPSPYVSEGQALHYLQNLADKILPQNVNYNYKGQSRQYVTESGGLMVTFFFAILVIYLVLAAQFESFRDPLIILVSVPMSISGALIPLNLGLATINIYTQIGLVTLIGLISKHGILMVEFANNLQIEEGLDKFEAVCKAAQIRLRAILMTTFAMVFGVIPLILATGAGAASRFDLGLVIAFGMSIGTLFTLFVVPAIYMLLAGDHHQDDVS